MAQSENNGGSHEPNLRELTADLAGVKALLLEKIDTNAKISDERDRRYEERFKAMDEKTGLALTSSEKAVVKAEMATEKRFDAVNEFRGTLSDQAATLMPRAEAMSKFASYEKEIQSIREQLKETSGKEMASDRGRTQNQWTFANVLTILFLIIATVTLFVAFKK